MNKDDYELCEYVNTETSFVCGRCKHNYPIFQEEDALEIALDPSLLFEGDVLICTRCTREDFAFFKNTGIKYRMCNFVDHPNCIFKYRFRRGVPDQTHIYNVLHDYRTIMRTAIGMRNGNYPLHVIQPYHNFRHDTLFDITRKKLKY